MSTADSILFRGMFRALALGKSVVVTALLAGGLLAASDAQAGKLDGSDRQAAGAFISELTQQISAASQSEDSANQTSHILASAQLLRVSIDVKATGSFVLGPYRTKATDEQRSNFDAVLSDLLLRNYLEHFAAAPGERLELLSTRAISKTDTLVETKFEGADGMEVTAWRVRKAGDTFRIIDLAVDGMSLAITQRRSFTSIAGIKGFDAALVAMQDDLTSKAPISVAGKGPTAAYRSVLASIFGGAKKGTVGLAIAGLK